MARGEISTNTDETVEVTHQFINSTQQAVTLNWVDFEGEEVTYQTLEPGHASSQGTFSTHPWRMRWPDKQVLGSYVGMGARIEILGPGAIKTEPLDIKALMCADPAWGQWRKRAEVSGIPINAYDCVDESAVRAACDIIHNMLRNCPTDILARLVSTGANVGIIGRNQLTSDMPGHQHLKLNKGGRDLDATTRGLGGNHGCPMCTCGEENLTMVNDDRYPCENILIHEFAHTVMTLGMSEEQHKRVKDSYDRAVQANKYAKGCYALENEDEYWAEGTQSWFDATVRTDVNGGINTREKLTAHDRTLADIMAEVYGPNPWRYPHTAPARFQGAESSAVYAQPSPYSTYTHSASIPRPTAATQYNNGYAYPYATTQAPSTQYPYPNVPQYGQQGPYGAASTAYGNAGPSYGAPAGPVYNQPYTAYAQPVHVQGPPGAYMPPGPGAAPAYPPVEPASSSLCGLFSCCLPKAQSRPAYEPPQVHYGYSAPHAGTWRDANGYSADSKMQ